MVMVVLYTLAAAGMWAAWMSKRRDGRTWHRRRYELPPAHPQPAHGQARRW